MDCQKRVDIRWQPNVHSLICIPCKLSTNSTVTPSLLKRCDPTRPHVLGPSESYVHPDVQRFIRSRAGDQLPLRIKDLLFYVEIPLYSMWSNVNTWASKLSVRAAVYGQMKREWEAKMRKDSKIIILTRIGGEISCLTRHCSEEKTL